jgi:dTDP-4-amino-4,6-dideoxygalactose transaminase
VLVPGFTFVATAAAVRYCGAEPVLCDVVSASHGLLDAEDAASRITPRTRAMVAVHMFGYAADVAALRAVCDEHGIVLVEDVAQAVGARLPGGAFAGTGGEMGCFSLFSKKQLCTGEGGVVLTADAELAARLRALRDARTPDGPGLPQTLAEPHAALGLNRLPRLAADIEVRRSAVRGYRERLAGLPGLELTFDDASVEAGSHFAFPVLAADAVARDVLKGALRASGIQTTNYPALTRLSAYAGTPSLPRAEAVADRHLCLPLSSHTTQQQVALVAAAVTAAV